MEPMIKLENIHQEFDGETILDNINLNIYEGEIVTIIGPSGAGKSTLLRFINLLNRPTSGKIYYLGEDIIQNRKKHHYYRSKISMVFQSFNLFPQYTALGNVMLAKELLAKSQPDYKARKKEIHTEIEAEAKRLLDQMGLSERMNNYPHQLSGGQCQRVAIARALVNRPKVLLLDEPLGALDLRLRKDMQNELKRIQQQMGITFIYVTHDQEEALTMSDTVVVMDKGRIQQIGTPEDIYNEPKNAFVADFIGESNILNGTMVRDRVVKMYGKEFPCVDGGFAENEPVDVVIRPEDIDIVPVEQGQLVGTVTNVTFKGMQYDIIVDFRGFKWLIQTTDHSPVGARIGVKIDPEGFHIMKKSEYSGMFGDYSSYSEEYEELADAGAEPEEEESEDEE